VQGGEDSAMASSTGLVRDFNAITTASISSPRGSWGTPIICTVRMPAFTSMPAKSVPPVKSSAMQPSRTVILLLLVLFPILS
jgi:hypothetical protein